MDQDQLRALLDQVRAGAGCDGQVVADHARLWARHQTVTDPANRRFTLTWTGSHITGLTDTAGRTVTYAYDAAGNLSDVFGMFAVSVSTT